MNDIFAARRERVRATLAEHEISALLVSYASNRYYLSGFELHDTQCNESSGMLLIAADGRDKLLTDPRFLDAAKRLWPEEDVFIYTAPKFETMTAFLKDAVSGAIGFEPQAVSFATHDKLSAELTLKPVDGVVESLRLIKDEVEIDVLRRSCALNHKVFKQIESRLKPGMTEAELAWEAEKLFREQGASELSFPTIAAVGPNGALPHAVPGYAVIGEETPVLVDMGCRLDNYCSDQTRTFWVGGNPTDSFRSTMAQVREAQSKAIAMIRPGLQVKEAYATAMECFEKYGVGEFFTHSLGHGIGLETHEGPSIGKKGEQRFQQGMVITCEPGLYYPEWGGVRWEYMALITEEGCEIL